MILPLLGSILVLGAPAAAAPQDAKKHIAPPIAFLKEHDARVRAILSQAPGDTLPPKLRTRVKELINSAFDFAELSRLALGDHWQGRTLKERADFVATFSGIIEEQNFDSFVRYYREGNIEYTDQKMEEGRAEVVARVPLKRETVEIKYLMHLVDGQWKVYDLVIDGASTAEGNRRRYARYIEKNSYEKLAEQLDKQLAKLLENRN